MRRKDLQDFRAKDVGELQKAVEERVLQLRRLTAEIGLGREKNVSQAKNVRRELAQFKSVLREKGLKGGQ